MANVGMLVATAATTAPTAATHKLREQNGDGYDAEQCAPMSQTGHQCHFMTVHLGGDRVGQHTQMSDAKFTWAMTTECSGRDRLVYTANATYTRWRQTGHN